jgi:dCMP deaminase
MKHKYILTYLRVAQEIAKLSPDPNTKVGCVIAKPTGELISTGFNGTVRGCNEDFIPLIAPAKYEFFFHSENNALLNCARNGISTLGMVAFVTHSPCPACCRALIQAGIKRIYFLTKHKSFQLQALDYSGTLINYEYYYELRL